jgi:phosphoglucosamine mutase
VREKADLPALPDVARVMASVERQLGDQGRLLVRYSGTEPLLRIMLEGQDSHQIKTWAEEIAAAVRTAIGA